MPKTWPPPLRFDGASAVEPLDEPGGGRRVRFDRPRRLRRWRWCTAASCRSAATGADGAALELRKPSRTPREALQRFEPGPAQVKRLGHVVIRVSDFRTSEAWYKQRFGFISSDEVHLGDPEKVLAAFMRCDRGEEYVDHHTFVCLGAGEPGFEHAAFEVEDVDSVMLGHDHLKVAGYTHAAGIGRHVLGSQVFDYWRDPWGNVLEHFTDGDLLNVHHETGSFEPSVVLGTQWGRFAVE